MNLMWFFDVETLASTHLFLEELEHSHELLEVVAMLKACRRDVKIKEREPMPI
jgi:hypothetical protein